MQNAQLFPIPKLSRVNYNLWLDVVRVAATANGIQDHVTSDPAPRPHKTNMSLLHINQKKAIA